MKKILTTMMTSSVIAIPLAMTISCASKVEDGEVSLNGYASRARVGNYSISGKTAENVKIALVGDSPVASQTDHSFNQIIYEAIEKYYAKHGRENEKPTFIKPASADATGYQAAYNNGFNEHDIVVAAGFKHTVAINDTQYNIPANKGFIINGVDVLRQEVSSNVYDLNQAAFQAGIAASMYLNQKKETFNEDGHLKVGAYAGIDIPDLLKFMGGFQQGVKYFNENLKKENDIEIEFIDLGTREEYFSGSFDPGGGTAISEKLIRAGADVILPVAGVQAEDTLAAINRLQAKTMLIGVDTPMEDQPAFQEDGKNEKVLFSITQNAEVAIEKMMDAIITNTAKDGVNVLGGLTIGSLENGMMAISRTKNSVINTAEFENIYETINSEAVKSNAVSSSLKWEF